MKTLLGLAALGAAAALGFASTSTAGEPRIPPWGFDLAGRDTTAKPGDDFYGYANGTFVKNLQIPPDRSRFGNFDQLQAQSEDHVHYLLEKAADNKDGLAEDAKVGAFYRAFMDESRVEALGARPLAPDLAQIRAAGTPGAIAALMGKAPHSFFSSLFDIDIGVDAKDPQHYAVYIGQGGLGLPNRDYYLEPSFAAQKAGYQAYVAQILKLEGWADAEAQAAAIVELETKVAKASWPLAEQRDPTKTYNPMTPAELAAAAPGFDWAAFLQNADVGSATRVVVSENTALPQIVRIFAETPVATLQAWEAFNVGDSAAPYLSKDFVEASFAFRNKMLSGQQELRPRWKRAVSVVNNNMGFAVGQLYVKAYFPADSKAKMEALVGNIRQALAARIQRVTWMSDATKQRALQKLSMLNVKIGYPTKWRDYSRLQVSEAELYGDIERSAVFDWMRKVNRLGQPVDRTEWGITPQTVNAYYSPTRNEIVFPAAILQSPFFDPAADMAVNYGGIGAVIGHEMTHGFDDSGRHFDGTGALADWWTPEDDTRFVAQTKILGAQYSAFEPLDGVHVKGDQTMGENIADLGGLLLAIDAYHASLGGKPAPVLSGLTGDQRLLLGFAQIWRSAIRPDALRRQIVSDPHSPEVDRVDGTVRNVDAWYSAFNVTPGESLYLAPDQRVRIW
ncbi:MAG TPA: M13 family metallopeptidase [Caulobacteraceae bacterium]|nr:M13 family metallopeptidase [Caulobacteraceae bacterium]